MKIYYLVCERQSGWNTAMGESLDKSLILFDDKDKANAEVKALYEDTLNDCGNSVTDSFFDDRYELHDASITQGSAWCQYYIKEVILGMAID